MNTTEVTYVHFLLAFPWIAIAAGLGLEKIKIKPIFIFAVSLILLLMMPWFYDIGNTMDQNLSAQKFYEALRSLPDGAIVSNMICIEKTGALGIDERSGIAIMVLNKDEKRKIIALNEGPYLSLDETGEAYRRALREQYGINTPIAAVLAVNPYGMEATMSMKNAPLYSVTKMIAEENPDRKVYYSSVPEENCMDRSLVEIDKLYP